MIDAAQAVLLFVIIILTLLLLVLGFQVFFILRELRHTVTKANKVLDDAGVITESVSGPVATISNLATGVKAGALIASVFKGKRFRKSSSRGDKEDE